MNATPATTGATRPEKLKKKDYEQSLAQLNVELIKLQDWVKAQGLKVVVLFEGRDAAGKGGSIKRITEPLNPRVCRVVALGTPTEREKTQWYFQRYVAHLPAAGEIVLFDRSWYNRAGVERVMGFCTDDEYWEFLRTVPRVREDADQLGDPPGQVLVLGERRGTGAPVPGPHQRPRPSAGRSARWTSSHAGSGSSTPRPRTRCSTTPTPRSPRGGWSTARRSAGPGSTASPTCCRSSRTRTSSSPSSSCPRARSPNRATCVPRSSRCAGFPTDAYSTGIGGARGGRRILQLSDRPSRIGSDRGRHGRPPGSPKRTHAGAQRAAGGCGGRTPGRGGGHRGPRRPRPRCWSAGPTDPAGPAPTRRRGGS